MDLRLALILRIALAALVCLCALSGYGLLQTSRESARDARETATAVGKQLDFQLIRLAIGSDYAERFPDWDAVLESQGRTGFCVRFVRADGNLMRSTCYRAGSSDPKVPAWFAAGYRRAFAPGREAIQPVVYRDRRYGDVIVAADVDTEIERAWRDARSLLRLTTLIVLTLSALIYVSVSYALRPARRIVSALARLEGGDRSARLPRFRMREFDSIAVGVNRLAAGLAESLLERLALDRRLITVQEEERRHLARELHDEFGQSLAAINAAAASIEIAAGANFGDVAAETERIGRVVEGMMAQLRGMLLRLRPSGMEELGLLGSLRGLINDWNGRHAQSTKVLLQAVGDLSGMPDAVNVNLFRIVQECLTNVAKHAGASEVTVRLERQHVETQEPAGAAGIIDLAVTDNGAAKAHSASGIVGMGILGIRERVAALSGSVSFHSPAGGGFVAHVRIPLSSTALASAS